MKIALIFPTCIIILSGSPFCTNVSYNIWLLNYLAKVIFLDDIHYSNTRTPPREDREDTGYLKPAKAPTLTRACLCLLIIQEATELNYAFSKFTKHLHSEPFSSSEKRLGNNDQGDEMSIMFFLTIDGMSNGCQCKNKYIFNNPEKIIVNFVLVTFVSIS